jgi:gamma-glutamyltranspeptidase / glutathione hydrolase
MLDPHSDPNDAFAGFLSRRSVVYSTRGVVSTVSPLATQAGLRTLREGGNAAVRHLSSTSSYTVAPDAHCMPVT